MSDPGDWREESKRRLRRAIAIAVRLGWDQAQINRACGVEDGVVPDWEQQAIWLERALLERLRGASTNEQYMA